ncbi:MAG TPA: prolyl oligopeptidase family serine peptidase [Rhizomicrobium sp.]
MALGARQITGPRLPPLRGKATHLVVLCHGYGADGNDLIGLAPHWQRLLPTVAFVAPNAPELCAAGGSGYQWFPISRLDPSEMRRGVELAAPTLESFLVAELARLELAPERLALVGFSQGTMMALHVGLHRAVKPAAIVGYSGMLAGEPPPSDANTPPILLIHGEADPMIPPTALFTSAAALARAGAAVQWHISPGIGHSIDEVGLTMGGTFLAAGLRGMLARKGAEISCPVE